MLHELWGFLQSRQLEHSSAGIPPYLTVTQWVRVPNQYGFLGPKVHTLNGLGTLKPYYLGYLDP